MKKVALLVFIVGVLAACKSGPFNLIKSGSPHQLYERKLVSSGLNATAMGAAWINIAQRSLTEAVPIQLPYQERGYFSAEKPLAAAFKFRVTKGQKLTVEISKQPTTNFMIYTDLWERDGSEAFKLLRAADTLGNPLQLDADETSEWILRIQPELLGAGSYLLKINTGPSLGYPLKSANSKQIQSLYGDGRDDNSRKHEGIDIFAPFRTPVVAVAAGTVTRVNTNNLGGKVVWMRPEGKDYNLYYAHLDEQSVAEGQQVIAGDTLGRMGNTGNAKTTPPHLHFGIYTNGGTVDPLPYINPRISDPPKITVNTDRLNATMRTIGRVKLNQRELNPGTILQVDAAAANGYRVRLPDGETGHITARLLNATDKPLNTYKVQNELALYDRPDSAAAVKSSLKPGQTVQVLGTFGKFRLVTNKNEDTGWIR